MSDTSEVERLRGDFATAVQRAGQAHADAERKIADVMDRTEAEVERLRADVRAAYAERDQQFERKAAALRERDEARRELAEIKRVTDPPKGDEEMPTDPAELREMWEFINRQARWQWHMATKFNSKLERVRAQHRQDDPEDPMCRHCRMTWPCPTIRALNTPTPTTRTE